MDQKVRGLLAYLFGWIGGLVVLLAYKDNDSRTKFKNSNRQLENRALWRR